MVRIKLLLTYVIKLCTNRNIRKKRKKKVFSKEVSLTIMKVYKLIIVNIFVKIKIYIQFEYNLNTNQYYFLFNFKIIILLNQILILF